MATIVTNTLKIDDGQLTEKLFSAATAIPATLLAQRSLQEFKIPLTSGRVHNAPQTSLGAEPAGGASGSLGVVGTAGTTSQYLSTGDQKAQGALSYQVQYEAFLPFNYVAGETVQVKAHAGMITTVADTSCTLDLQCYKKGSLGAIGADICATSAFDINSTTGVSQKFTITSTSLEPGDTLSLLFTIAVNDAATGTAVIGAISDVALLCDTQG